jgi:predicted TPR repeat methyltransferase
MPISDPKIREIATKVIVEKPANNVLDIGIGYGFYGKFIKSKNPEANIYGIEIYPKYITDQLDYYKTIFLCNAKDFEYELLKSKIDLVIAADVIEHFSKDEATVLLKRLMSLFPRGVITIPVNVVKDGIVYFEAPLKEHENKHEIHQSNWTVTKSKA